MDKITYLAELAEGLARWVPERERQDILRYYAEYFDEAGPERESEVVQELGDPWALSCRLAVEGGFVTQEKADAWTPRQNKRKWPWMLAAGATAAVLVFTVISVALAASQFGRIVGRLVVSSVEPVTVVEDYAIAESTGMEDFSGIAFYDYEFETDLFNSGFWSMEDGYLEAFDSIDCDINLGNVTVCEGEDFTLYIEQRGRNVKWEINGSTLKIRDADGSGLNAVMVGSAGNWGADVCITVPQTAALDKVSVKTDTGDVFIGAVTAGKVTAETKVGDVQCYEVYEVRKLNLKADTGDIFLGLGQLWSGVELELEADVGDVEVQLGCWERECAYELETDVGEVLVNDTFFGQKAEEKGDLPYKLDVESDVGDIHVFFYIGQKG